MIVPPAGVAGLRRTGISLPFATVDRVRAKVGDHLDGEHEESPRNIKITLLRLTLHKIALLGTEGLVLFHAVERTRDTGNTALTAAAG